MDNTLTTLRPSLAAIAAALALSATPAFAQTADPAATPAPAPVTIAPPAPTVAPAASAAPAADQTSNLSAPVDDTPAAPAASAATQSPVVVHTAPDAAPAVAARTPVTHAAAPAAKAAAAPVAPAPVAKAAPAPAPAPVLRDPPPTAAPAQAQAQAQTKVSSTTRTDDTALYAGLGGAAVLILGGGAFALSRRKRDEEEAYEAPVIEERYVAAAPIVATETRYDAAPAVAVPVATDEEMVLANGFDLSRFGPHTRAAYRGPTEDNPSLSLKKRLKVASFLDGRLRESGEYEDVADSYVEPATRREGRRVFASKLSDRLNFRPGPRTSFRPATA